MKKISIVVLFVMILAILAGCRKQVAEKSEDVAVQDAITEDIGIEEAVPAKEEGIDNDDGDANEFLIEEESVEDATSVVEETSVEDNATPIPNYQMGLINAWEENGIYHAGYLVISDSQGHEVEPNIRAVYNGNDDPLTYNRILFTMCYAGHAGTESDHESMDKNAVVVIAASNDEFDPDAVSVKYVSKDHYEEDLRFTVNADFDAMYEFTDELHKTGVFCLNGVYFVPDTSVVGSRYGSELTNTLALYGMASNEDITEALSGTKDLWDVCYGRKGIPEGKSFGDAIDEVVGLDKVYHGDFTDHRMLPEIILNIGYSGIDLSGYSAVSEYPQWAQDLLDGGVTIESDGGKVFIG